MAKQYRKVTVCISIDDDLLQFLRNNAAERRQTVSGLLRTLVLNYRDLVREYAADRELKGKVSGGNKRAVLRLR